MTDVSDPPTSVVATSGTVAQVERLREELLAFLLAELGDRLVTQDREPALTDRIGAAIERRVESAAEQALPSAARLMEMIDAAVVRAIGTHVIAIPVPAHEAVADLDGDGTETQNDGEDAQEEEEAQPARWLHPGLHMPALLVMCLIAGILLGVVGTVSFIEIGALTRQPSASGEAVGGR